MKTFTVQLFDDRKVEIKADHMTFIDSILCFMVGEEIVAVFDDFEYAFSEAADIYLETGENLDWIDDFDYSHEYGNEVDAGLKEKPYDEMADYGRE